MRSWERDSHFLRQAQAVSAQGARCEGLLLLGREWKWGSRQDLGTRSWLSRAHGCSTLQTGVRACRRVPGGAALQEADDLLNGGLLVLVGPPVGTEAGGSGGWAVGAAGCGACVPTPPPPPHLMPLKVSTACMSSGRAWGSGHSKPSMMGTMFLPQLKAVTISWRKKGGGRDQGAQPGTPGRGRRWGSSSRLRLSPVGTLD